MAFRVQSIYRHRGWVSLLLTAMLLVACYLWENVPLAYGESFDRLYFAERYIQKHFGQNKTVSDGLFINVSYDKAIAEIDLYDMNGLFTGKVDITDRETLDRLLERLEEDNTYRYIFLDVRFEKGIQTPVDSSLFHRIARMRDIVIDTHRDMELASPLLEPKACISDYKTTITSTGFTRYQFLQKGKESVALKMYEDLTGEDIRQWGKSPVFFSAGALCHNSLFIRIPEDFSENLVDVHLDGDGDGATGIHRQRYFDCGPQIDEDFPLAEEAEGKIVVIGDFVNDVAGTYMGEQPNPYLAFLAEESLMGGKHKVSLWYVFILAVLFYLTFLAMLSKKGTSAVLALFDALLQWFRKKLGKVKEKDPQEPRISWLNALLWNFFGFSISTFVICIILFRVFDMTFSIFIPSLVFSAVAAVTQTWEHLDKQKKEDEKV